MRLVLMTGKGGVGKTTLSAATAMRAAASGRRTLVMSTDAAHSLAEVFETELGPDPRRIGDHLDGVHLDGGCEIERSWQTITNYVRQLLGSTEIGQLYADELLAVPGLDQLLALIRLRDLVERGRWDAVVIDCAPSADNLRLLALPNAVSFFLNRLFGRSGALRTLARRRFERTFAIPAPDDDVLASVNDLIEALSRVEAMFSTATTTARIIVNPERIVIAEGQRTMSYLALYGYAVDAVIVNRVIGPHLSGTVLHPWIQAQQANLENLGELFGELPVLTVSHQMVEPLGMTALEAVADEMHREREPMDVMVPRAALSITIERDETLLRVPVGGANRDDLRVLRRDRELVITLHGHRRAVALPDSLRDREVRRAGVAHGCLEIAFAGSGDGR